MEKTTIQRDRECLRWQGSYGHDFVGVADDPSNPDRSYAYATCSTLESCRRLANVNRECRVYQRTGRKWKRIATIPAAQLA